MNDINPLDFAASGSNQAPFELSSNLAISDSGCYCSIILAMWKLRPREVRSLPTCTAFRWQGHHTQSGAWLFTPPTPLPGWLPLGSHFWTSVPPPVKGQQAFLLQG